MATPTATGYAVAGKSLDEYSMIETVIAIGSTPLTPYGTPGTNEVPQVDGKHPQHGELPNADFDNAYIEMADDYIEVGGTYNYVVSFVKNYSFTPRCRLCAGDTARNKIEHIL